jgi:hypothetical protein
VPYAASAAFKPTLAAAAVEVPELPAGDAQFVVHGKQDRQF